MDPQWIAGGCFLSGTVVAGIIGALGSVRVARIVGKDAMAREERQYARQDEVARRLVESNADIAAKVEQVHLATNSMKDALVAATASASDAAGEKRGIEIGRAESVKNS
jgi:hypothetical protein